MKIWPIFTFEDQIGKKYFNKIYEQFPQFQNILIHQDTGELIALGNTVPLEFHGSFEYLSDRGWDWVLEKAFLDYTNQRTPNIAGALSVSINPKFKGYKLGSIMIQGMGTNAKRCGLTHMIVPVRPMLKNLYPLVPIQKYILWKNLQGDFFDPWLRAHQKMGAQLFHVCCNSMVTEGSVQDWQKWAGLEFPESGEYIVDKAHNPISIDVERNFGQYIEPNVWMVHLLSQA